MRKPKTLAQSIDRRKFLLGAAGGMLALPMLEAHSPRLAHGQSAAPPKRLLMVVHPSGRGLGGYRKYGVPDKVEDAWSPLAATGPLPATGDLSPLLKGLGEIRNEIVTIDGIDNLARHICNDPDGHLSSILSCLTGSSPAKLRAGRPSITSRVSACELRRPSARRWSSPRDPSVKKSFATTKVTFGAQTAPPPPS
jgi:hypothetical protein